MTARSLPTLFVVCTMAVALCACGRAGAPLKPSEAAAAQAKANNEPAPVAPTPNSQNPDKPFILDRLLR